MAMYRRSRSLTGDALHEWYHTVQQTILAYQDPITGLFPAFLLSDGTATSDAWVRDNTYTIMCVWALSIAYHRQHELKENTAKAVELEQAVVKHMRGLLLCMMQQVGKVERFKATQSRYECLHAKYNRHTGTTAVGDNEWGHLQIDATSLYLLTLAQMTASGLQIIYSLDEVAFIQNLVFYIEEAYRIPDYGVWERGDKTNNGEPELNASSIGMAKAALQALDGLDLFGSRGGPSSVIHVMEDELQQCNAKLESLLPRESMSKEIDAALLSIVSFPAFAVQKGDLIEQVKEEILTQLLGNYGCKRFLRDGYQTVKEDPSRLYYHPAELKMFDNIECEWPLFFSFLVIDGIFTGNLQQVAKFGEMMEKSVVRDQNGLVHMPELYYVPLDKVELEYRAPHSQERYWGTKWQSMWAQSLYILANLLRQDFVEVGDLDPLNRRLAAQPRPDIVVQVALVCEDRSLQRQLASRGIDVQTVSEAQISCQSPLSILSAKSLGAAYQRLGINKKMGLGGRRQQKMGVLSTSQLYTYEGNFYAFTPQIMDQEQFYLWLDNSLLVDLIRTAIAYLRSNWKKLGRPTMTLPIMKLMLGDPSNWDKNPIWHLIEKMNSGYVRGTRILVGKLCDLVNTSCITKLTFLEQDRDKDVLPLYSKLSPSLKQFQRLSSVLESSPHLPRKAGLPSDIKGSVMRNRRSIFAKPRELSEAELAPAWSIARSQGKTHLSATTIAMRSPSHSRRSSMSGTSIAELMLSLQSSEDIQEQADILHHLYTCHGPKLSLDLETGDQVTVESLLDETYQKASAFRLWPLLRHTAGLLHKNVEDLAQAVSDLLVRQKQLSVGLPNPAYRGGEIDIMHPMSNAELLETIEKGCGSHYSAVAVTQEIIIYLAMFIRLEPHLFEDMWRLRVGMIMTIVVQELGRFLDSSLEEATDTLLNINPCGLKNLLYHLLSGKEFRIDQIEPLSATDYYEAVPQVSIVTHSKRDMSVQLKHDIGLMGTEVEEKHLEERVGVWRRRRRLDGALNRVPKEFFSQVWYILEKCDGIQIGKHFLPQKPTIHEMTAKEWKFALQVESVLNTLREPEYRQLVVEALMLVALVVQHDRGQSLGQVLVVDHLIADANRAFLTDQCANEGPAKECCCLQKGACQGPLGICIHFYDSAPSGRYGTMSYFSHALVEKLKLIPTTSTDCRVS